MTQALLTIAGRQFFPDSDAVAGIEEEIARLVHEGGGFVIMQTRRGPVDVFVSTGVAITVDHFSDDLLDDEGDAFPSFDSYN